MLMSPPAINVSVVAAHNAASPSTARPYTFDVLAPGPAVGGPATQGAYYRAGRFQGDVLRPLGWLNWIASRGPGVMDL